MPINSPLCGSRRVSSTLFHGKMNPDELVTHWSIFLCYRYSTFYNSNFDLFNFYYKDQISLCPISFLSKILAWPIIDEGSTLTMAQRVGSKPVENEMNYLRGSISDGGLFICPDDIIGALCQLGRVEKDRWAKHQCIDYLDDELGTRCALCNFRCTVSSSPLLIHQ